jgi:hypothetical protein
MFLAHTTSNPAWLSAGSFWPWSWLQYVQIGHLFVQYSSSSTCARKVDELVLEVISYTSPLLINHTRSLKPRWLGVGNVVILWEREWDHLPHFDLQKEEIGEESRRVGTHLWANPNIVVYNFLDPNKLHNK